MTKPSIWDSVEVDAISRGFDHAEYLRSCERHGLKSKPLSAGAYRAVGLMFDLMMMQDAHATAESEHLARAREETAKRFLNDVEKQVLVDNLGVDLSPNSLFADLPFVRTP